MEHEKHEDELDVKMLPLAGRCWRLNVNWRLNVKGVRGCLCEPASEPISELRSITCHMRSNSITCHSTQISSPYLNHSQTVQYLIYLLRRDGRLSWPLTGATCCTSIGLSVCVSVHQCREFKKSWWDRKLQFLDRISTDNSKFLTKDIVSAQNFNFTPKFF